MCALVLGLLAIAAPSFPLDVQQTSTISSAASQDASATPAGHHRETVQSADDHVDPEAAGLKLEVSGAGPKMALVREASGRYRDPFLDSRHRPPEALV